MILWDDEAVLFHVVLAAWLEGPESIPELALGRAGCCPGAQLGLMTGVQLLLHRAVQASSQQGGSVLRRNLSSTPKQKLKLSLRSSLRNYSTLFLPH